MTLLEMILHLVKKRGALEADVTKWADQLDAAASVSDVAQALQALEESGQLMRTKKQKYAIPETLGFAAGRIQATARGFAFLIPDRLEEDVFLPAAALQGAMHGDRVLVELDFSPAGGIPGRSASGAVVRVIERAYTRIVGTLCIQHGQMMLRADDKRLIEMAVVEPGGDVQAQEGVKAVLEITAYPKPPQGLRGKVIEVLGYPDEVGCDILSIIRQYDLPDRFPTKVLASAGGIPQAIDPGDIEGREDLRNELVITIDGEDAKDLDDAICLKERASGGFLLGVHIADVSHYVADGKPIDREAYYRGTSVYLPDRVLPMLPTTLSNGICSLTQGQDRLALTAWIDFDAQGKVTGRRFAQSVIRSRLRMSYDQVDDILEGVKASEDVAEAVPMLLLMKRLCLLLRGRRFARGSLDFDLPEAKIVLDAQGKPERIIRQEHTLAHCLIEEFMLAANQAVAIEMNRQHVPIAYRVHEKPDVEKMLSLALMVRRLGFKLDLKEGSVTPSQLQALLKQAKGSPEEALIGRTMLRSLQKARYHAQNLGHFGLATKDYCHFTSPIRRYPDLVTHRALKRFIAGQATEPYCQKQFARMPDICQQSSLTERRAMEAEREAVDLKKTEYISAHIGEEFEGVLSGVTEFGLFVELDNTVEGLVHVTSMQDDYYQFDEAHQRLVGERHHAVYRLGDKVVIRVAGVDIQARRVDFTLVSLPMVKSPNKSVRVETREGNIYNKQRSHRRRGKNQEKKPGHR